MEDQNLPENFPDPNSDEGLNIENELLKLKMRAELGASMFEINNLPPDIENAFLKNVLAFEQEWENCKMIKVYEKLSKPEFVPEAELKDNELTDALLKLDELLNNNNIHVDYVGNYSDRIKYKFLTEELFDVEMNDMGSSGMTTCFIYEEFHPDHIADITSKAESFIENWFEKNISEKDMDLADHFIHPDGKMIEKKTVVDQIQNIFNLSEKFVDGKLEIIDTSFDLMADGNGMGYVEGLVGYRAVLANAEREVIAGPFKIYFSLEHGWWQIVHLVFPGFGY